jgi:large subunit ribosomal protein L25
MQFELTAKKRTDQGTGASRRLRRAGRVPAIVYGGNEAAQAIDLDMNTILLNLRKESFHASILVLDVEGKKESVLLRDSQLHPYKAVVLHVDFQRVDPNQKLHQKIPLHFVNEDVAPGVKLSGGLVSHAMNELDVSCLPANLPEFIEVDLKDLKVGQSIHVKDLALPKGVSVVSHGQDNPVVVSIVAKKGGSDEAAVEAAPAA